MATKKSPKKGKTAPKTSKKSTKKKAKVKKGAEYACGICGNVVTMNTVETVDGVYGYVEEDILICCGEVMKEK